MIVLPEAALHRCSYEKLFWKYAANLQENNRAEVWFITLRHVCSPVNLLHIFRAPLYRKTYGGCFCIASHISFSRSSQENVWKKSATKGNAWLTIHWFLSPRKTWKKDKVRVPQRNEMLSLYCTALGFIGENEENELILDNHG